PVKPVKANRIATDIPLVNKFDVEIGSADIPSLPPLAKIIMSKIITTEISRVSTTLRIFAFKSTLLYPRKLTIAIKTKAKTHQGTDIPKFELKVFWRDPPANP